ncbi:class II histocompatibility antigen, B-L beta chain-like [Pseudopipra pipra]|uniref:class II histocompatibility antigen, B-L beta chain-like n=1 Tax=Pseudopipra pipra TaxID=415032 RepID=UPI003139A324
MERVRGAGAVLAVLVVLGAPPAAGEELSGVFQWMGKQECHFINGTEQVRFLERHFYNREQLLHFDSDVGVYVGDTPFGEIQARDYNSHQMPPDTVRSKILVGVGGFVLGLVFLVLGLGFYLREKSS